MGLTLSTDTGEIKVGFLYVVAPCGASLGRTSAEDRYRWGVEPGRAH